MGAIAPKEDAKGGRFLTPFAQWVQLLRNGCNCSEKCTPITRKKCPFDQLLGGFAPKNGGSQRVKYWVLLLRIMQYPSITLWYRTCVTIKTAIYYPLTLLLQRVIPQSFSINDKS